MASMKWILALAGTAMGLRYMSGRQRKRLAGMGSSTGATTGAPQRDRDAPNSWPARDNVASALDENNLGSVQSNDEMGSGTPSTNRANRWPGSGD